MSVNSYVKSGNLVATAIVLLGVIHNVATFTPLIRGGLSCLSPGNIKAITFFSLVCGSSFILSGLLLIMLLKKLELHKYLMSAVSVIGVFLIISGFLSVIYLFSNPIAWVGFIMCAAEFVIILLLRKSISGD